LGTRCLLFRVRLRGSGEIPKNTS